MSAGLYFGFALPLFVVGQIWISIQKWPTERWGNEDNPMPEGVARIIGAFGALVWPAPATIAILWFPLVFAPRWTQRRYVARCERVAHTEAAAKLAADGARYEVERGAHR